MAKVFSSIKNWFVGHMPTRRRLIQVYAALLYNANLKGYISGEIYTGNTKYMCVPGMNCYSCPGAVAACPLGALQNALSASDKRPAYFVLGIIGLFGLILGRTICGFLCPVGLGQDLLYKIKTPKLGKSKVTRLFSYLKYVSLVVLVIAIPVLYTLQGNPGTPGFCKTICPAGTFGGGLGLLLNPKNWSGSRDLISMLGPIFTWKFALLVAIIVASIFLYRPFCRFLCPLGAIYGFFNRIALLGVKLDKNKCTDCGLCVEHCKMDIKHVGDHECINCGECMSVCPAKAITWKGSKIFLRANDTEPIDKPAPSPESTESVSLADIRTMNFKPVPVNATPAFSTMPAPAGAPIVRLSDLPQSEPTLDGSSASFEEHSENSNFEEPGEPQNDKKNKKAKKDKKPLSTAFWLRMAAFEVAIIFLVVVIVYYNVIDVKHKTYGLEMGNSLTNFEITIGDKATTIEDELGESATIVIFFDDSDASKQLIIDTQSAYIEFERDYHEKAEGTKMLALYTAASGASSAIGDLKEAAPDFVFGTETEAGSFEEAFESGLEDKAYPLTFTLNYDGIINSRVLGVPEVKAIDLLRSANSGPEVGMICPSFKLRTYGRGESGRYELLETTFDPYEHLGEVIVVNFWGVWCGPCVAELPGFNEVAQKYADKGVTVLAIHGVTAEDPGLTLDQTVAKFITQKRWGNYTLKFAQDEVDGNTCITYEKFGGMATWPMTFVIGKDGCISYSRVGELNEETLDEQIATALAK